MSYNSTVEEFNLYEIFEEDDIDTTVDNHDQVIAFDSAVELLIM